MTITPAPVAAPGTEQQAWYQALTVDALVDSYYQINLKNLDGDTLVPPAQRQFDTTSNSFSLNYAKIGLGFSLKPVAFRIDIGYGHTGAIINAASAGTTPATEGTVVGAASLYGNAFIVQQAFASLTLGDMLTLDFGKFMTTAGAEVIEANKNWLYSRSMLFYVLPLVHTGVRANLKVSDVLTLQASVVNGFNNDPDNNGEKTYGVSAAITPLPTTSIYATGYFGKEGPQGVEGPWRTTLDLVVAHNISDAFGLNLNFDYVKYGETNVAGAALMGRFVAAEHLVLAARGEFLSDKGIFLASTAASRTSFYEGTLMLASPFAKRFEARLEFRGDFASEDAQFAGEDNQFTGTVAFLGYM